jgi:MtaA/CmuA family methyltransferase
MTPKQRLEAALMMEPVDHVPVFYQHLGAASHLQKATGLITKDGFDRPEVFAKLSLQAYRSFGFDNVMAGWGDILVEAHAHGTEWRFTDPRFYPRVVRYVPMDKVSEVRPVDPMQDKTWSILLKAARIMLDEIGRGVAVVGYLNSPAVIASEVVGLENLMMALYQSPDVVDRLLATLTESSKAYSEEAAKLGIEEVFIENGTAGGELISRESYERSDRRYLKEEVEQMKRLGMRQIVHNCAALPYYESQLELEPTALHVHLLAVDRNELFSKVKGKACMMAGIDHTKLLFKGTPDEVEAEVKSIIELWGDSPGLIMAPGCELPYKTPLENLVRLREATARYGAGRGQA